MGKSAAGASPNKRRSRLSKPALWVGSAIVAGFLGAAGAAIWAHVQSLAPASDPLVARVDQADACPHVVLTQTQVEALPEVREDFTLDWAYGIDAPEFVHGQHLRISVQGTTEDAVVLQALRVIEVTRSDVPAGGLSLRACGGGDMGAPVQERYVEVDLTADPPRVVVVAGDAPQPTDFPYAISNAEPEQFDIAVAGDAEGVYEWKLGLDWTSGDREGTMVVARENGEPFRTAISSDLPMHVWGDGGTAELP
jgi:hypothetical protein